MAISDEITRLESAKENLKNSIRNKNVVVSDDITLDQYNTLIDQIATDTTATKADILNGKTAYINGKKETGEALAIQTNATRDHIVYGYSAYNSNGELLNGWMGNFGDIVITPSSEDLTYGPGYHESIYVKPIPETSMLFGTLEIGENIDCVDISTGTYRYPKGCYLIIDRPVANSNIDQDSILCTWTNNFTNYEYFPCHTVKYASNGLVSYNFLSISESEAQLMCKGFYSPENATNCVRVFSTNGCFAQGTMYYCIWL